MKLKLISNGTARGTRVVNAETGEEIEGIQSIAWRIDAREVYSRMTLTFVNIPVTVVADDIEYMIEGDDKKRKPLDITTIGKTRKFQLEG